MLRATPGCRFEAERRKQSRGADIPWIWNDEDGFLSIPQKVVRCS
jgi:hypothetical protein